MFKAEFKKSDKINEIVAIEMNSKLTTENAQNWVNLLQMAITDNHYSPVYSLFTCICQNIHVTKLL